MAQNTSEVLDLSKENIQPLRHGRKAAQLKTALQAQSNPEIRRMLLNQRDEFEYMIRMYEGDDPLELYYNYVAWLEQSFPKIGNDSNFIPLLEDIITKFKESLKYKQDIRFVRLLLKYIAVQPNPLELYKMVYHQGLGTMCSLFYKSWAEELDKNNDFKRADQVYQLGINCRAQPLQELQNDHVQFQLSIARRMLEGNLNILASSNEPSARTALSKLRPSTVKSSRTSRESAGVLQPFSKVPNNTVGKSGNFKVYEEENEAGYVVPESKIEHVGFPRNSVANQENIMEASKWRGVKHKVQPRLGITVPTNPSFEILEDPEAASAVIKTSRPQALKMKKEFKFPVAIFENPDSTKKSMYPKQLVYVGGRDVQLEEIQAAYYWKKVKEAEIASVVAGVPDEPVDLTKSSNTSIERQPELTPVMTGSAVQPPPKPEPAYEQIAWDEIDSAPIRDTCQYPPQGVDSVSRRTILNRISMSEVTVQTSSLPHEIDPTRKQSLSDSTLAGKAVSTAEISTRERSWYLTTEFIKPVKPPALDFVAEKRESEMVRSEVASLKRKSDSGETQHELSSRMEHSNSVTENAKYTGFDTESSRKECVARLHKLEDEILNFSNHSSKSNVSAFHHSPSASFTVNTRAAWNVIQKMWESPLAPRSAKMNRPDEDESSNVFKIPAARTSQCFKFPVFHSDENNATPAAPFTVFADTDPAVRCLPLTCARSCHDGEADQVESHNFVESKISGSIPCDKKIEGVKGPGFGELRTAPFPLHSDDYRVANIAEPGNEVAAIESCGAPEMANTVHDHVQLSNEKDRVARRESRMYTFPLYHEPVETCSPTTPSSKTTTDDEFLSKSIGQLKVTESISPLIIPIKLQETPPRPENKENRRPEEYLMPGGRRPLAEIEHAGEPVKQVYEIGDDEDELADEDTCSTRAFAIPLPSSTPFSRADGSRKSRKSSIFNGSYISEDCNLAYPAISHPKLPLQQMCETPVDCFRNPVHLSLILENSKEQGCSPGDVLKFGM